MIYEHPHFMCAGTPPSLMVWLTMTATMTVKLPVQTAFIFPCGFHRDSPLNSKLSVSAAGSRLAHLLHAAGCCNVIVVVSRW
jgi:hypothetical protein